ncbi:MAG: hypothetical protein ACI4UL_05645 [Muribaculaceae bacterium]
MMKCITYQRINGRAKIVDVAVGEYFTGIKIGYYIKFDNIKIINRETP